MRESTLFPARSINLGASSTEWGEEGGQFRPSSASQGFGVLECGFTSFPKGQHSPVGLGSSVQSQAHTEHQVSAPEQSSGSEHSSPEGGGHYLNYTALSCKWGQEHPFVGTHACYVHARASRNVSCFSLFTILPGSIIPKSHLKGSLWITQEARP